MRERDGVVGEACVAIEPLDPARTRGWIEPNLTDDGVQRGTVAFLNGVEKAELLDASTRLGPFDRPVLLVWDDADRMLKLESARRLQRTFPDAQLVEVHGGRTVLPPEELERVAAEIERAFYAPVPAVRGSVWRPIR